MAASTLVILAVVMLLSHSVLANGLALSDDDDSLHAGMTRVKNLFYMLFDNDDDRSGRQIYHVNMDQVNATFDVTPYAGVVTWQNMAENLYDLISYNNELASLEVPTLPCLEVVGDANTIAHLLFACESRLNDDSGQLITPHNVALRKHTPVGAYWYQTTRHNPRRATIELHLKLDEAFMWAYSNRSRDYHVHVNVASYEQMPRGDGPRGADVPNTIDDSIAGGAYLNIYTVGARATTVGTLSILKESNHLVVAVSLDITDSSGHETSEGLAGYVSFSLGADWQRSHQFPLDYYHRTENPTGFVYTTLHSDYRSFFHITLFNDGENDDAMRVTLKTNMLFVRNWFVTRHYVSY